MFIAGQFMLIWTVFQALQNEGNGFTLLPTLFLVGVDCGPLVPPEGATLQVSTTTYLSLALYSCDEGYTGDSTIRMCEANAMWTGVEPTCIRKQI